MYVYYRWKEYRSKSASVDSLKSALELAFVGTKKVGNRHGGTFTRWAALEARGSKRLGIGAILYIPVFFMAFGFILGNFCSVLHVLFMYGCR